MNHIVSLSGGSASAVCADRVISRYGSETVTLWFADTLFEDPDLYRFLLDLEDYWNKKIIRYVDGRNPLEVHDPYDFIPNNRFVKCSAELKQKPFRNFLKTFAKPVTVHLGLDWSEQHRHKKPKESYESITGVTVDFPLMWQPLAYLGYQKTIQEWGIKTPRLYQMGFPHNNCGGRCIRQGNSEWLRLLQYFPERFEAVMEWEKNKKEKSTVAKDHAISKQRINGKTIPLTLEQLKANNETTQIDMFDYVGDEYGCFCEY